MRVLLTRPRDQSEATAARLAGLGHEALIAPVLAIVPTGEAPPGGAFDAVLVTSANAMPALAAKIGRFAALPLLAVGARTGEAARAAGFTEVAVAEGDALALVELAARTSRPGASFLHAAGRDRKPEPARSLRTAGYKVATWECYAAERVGILPGQAAEAFRAGRIDAVLHYSRRTAEQLVRLAAEAGLGPALARVVHLCLSADVAEGLGALSPKQVLVAERPDETAFLALLGADLRPGSRSPQSRC